MQTQTVIRAATAADVAKVCRSQGLPPLYPVAAAGAFIKGDGLFELALDPIAIACVISPGQKRFDNALELKFVPLPVDHAVTEEMLGVLLKIVQDRTIVCYAPGGADPPTIVERVLEAHGFWPSGQTSGGHVGFDVCDAVGRPIKFKSARTTVSELGTRSVPAVAKLRPHWRPRYAAAKVLFKLDLK